MLATSGVLRALRTPFTYINNCRIDDEPRSARGVDRFLRVARVVKTMRSMEIGQIGQRIDFFWSTIINETDLLTDFGIQVLPIDMVEMIRQAVPPAAEKSDVAYRSELAGFRKWVSFNHFGPADDILYNFALRDELIEMAKRARPGRLRVQKFSSIPNEIGLISPVRAVAWWTTRAIPSPRSRICTARSVRCCWRRPARAADRLFCRISTIRHPENDNAVLLWHADAPLSLRLRNPR